MKLKLKLQLPWKLNRESRLLRGPRGHYNIRLRRLSGPRDVRSVWSGLFNYAVVSSVLRFVDVATKARIAAVVIELLVLAGDAMRCDAMRCDAGPLMSGGRSGGYGMSAAPDDPAHEDDGGLASALLKKRLRQWWRRCEAANEAKLQLQPAKKRKTATSVSAKC